MTKSNNHLIRNIYVALLNKGDDVWQCVEAVYEGEDSYIIISVNSNQDEHWEYTTGQRVRCRAIILPSGEHVLAATERLGKK